MHTRSSRFLASFSLILVGLLILSACNYPKASSATNTPTPDQNSIGTSAAQTLDANAVTLTAGATQSSQDMPNLPTTVSTEIPQASGGPVPPGTLPPPPPPPATTPELPAETPPPLPPGFTQLPPHTTLLPEVPSQAPPAQPGGPLVLASVNTNCRLGPSPAYPAIGALIAGQSSPALGRNNSNTWWFIQNPANPNLGCWVWGATAQIQGNPAVLRVINPPPPPPPTPVIPRLPTPVAP